jgi:hypothetical protein
MARKTIRGNKLQIEIINGFASRLAKEITPE